MKQQTLRDLVASGAVREATVIGMRGGYAIRVRHASVYQLLASSRGDMRLFTLDAATKLLRELGIPRFTVDATNFEPGRIRKPRPDRAEALRKTRTSPHQPMLV